MRGQLTFHPMTPVRVRLLGPVDVLREGVSWPVPGRRRAAILAALALRPGEVVGVDELIGLAWGDAPSAAAAVTLQSHISHLRGVLGDRSSIRADPPGYRLELGPEPTDVRVAERLIDRGTAADLTAALALWRGRPLADLAGRPGFTGPVARLDWLHRRARHDLIDARLALGEHDALIEELHGLADEDPHDERTGGQLMLALHRAGRAGDALAAYRRLRRALADDLGIDPSPALREQAAALQLPPAPAAFTGRGNELARLDALLGQVRNRVVVCVISGPAGSGKTALALHWAHRVADRFPDGRLHADLRTTDPAGAIRGFLDAFGVPAGPIAQDARFRSTLAGRRVLIVLDDARDAEQVRPLLPGTPGSLVVVTSRDRLTGLIAAEGAHPIVLDPARDGTPEQP